MACYHPVPAWYKQVVNESGKRGLSFKLDDGLVDRPIEIPCGTCIGCKLERARQWAVRCVHESQLYDSNCFVTLTYKDDPGTLVPRDMVLFLKRLRAKYGEGIRFFQCGEYGERLERPHHHAILFNLDFADRVFYNIGSDGVSRVYTSNDLESLWGHGFCTVGDVGLSSAGYVARYTLKKVVDSSAAAHYGGRVPEYLTMSRRPGIGRDWVEKYGRELINNGFVVLDGVKQGIPRYYDSILAERFPAEMREIKRKRAEFAAESVDNTGARLIVREVVKKASLMNGKLSPVGRPLEVYPG